jgi:hypothetical protein
LLYFVTRNRCLCAFSCAASSEGICQKCTVSSFTSFQAGPERLETLKVVANFSFIYLILFIYLLWPILVNAIDRWGRTDVLYIMRETVG